MHPKSREPITSAKNPIVRRVRDAARGETEGELVLDGARLVRDALAADVPIRLAAISPKVLTPRGGHELKAKLESAADEFFECSDSVLERMSSLDTPQGVIVIGARPDHDLAALSNATTPTVPLIAVAAGVRDPGNLGAIVRAAEAAGASGFVALEGGADPFRDKAVRGSAGSVLRLPTVHGVSAAELLSWAKRAGFQLVVAEGSAEGEYFDVDFTKPTSIVVGAEGDGLPAELRTAESVVYARIPMAASVESLNVAVAAGVLLFEAKRQRR